MMIFADKMLINSAISFRAKDICNNNYKIIKIPLRNIYKKLFYPLKGHLMEKRGFKIDMENLLKNQFRELYLDTLNSQAPFSDYLQLNSLKNKNDFGKDWNPIFQWSLFSLQAWYNCHGNDFN